MKLLFFGDIVGRSGRRALGKILPRLKKAYRPDLIIANVENLAHGKGVTINTMQELVDLGINFFTSGNHIFSKPEVKEAFLKFSDRFIRPANFSENLPGSGYRVIEVNGNQVAIINLNGQVFMENQYDDEISNPFVKLTELLGLPDIKQAKIKVLDFHVEATSEKRAMGLFADGSLSLVVGTHTHVQTNDAQLLPRGTGYISDVGMVGARDSVIGVEKDSAIRRFIAGEGSSEAGALINDESDQHEIGYLICEIDEQSGKCQNITATLEYL